MPSEHRKFEALEARVAALEKLVATLQAAVKPTTESDTQTGV